MLESIWQDLRFAGRMLRKQPGITLSAVLTMALGIGATTAVFSVVHALILAPLPFPDPDRLVMISETNLPKFPQFSVSPGNFLAWQEESPGLAGMTAFRRVTMNLTGGGDPERLRALQVSPGFLDLVGLVPTLGRGFSAEENTPGHADVVVMSHELWMRRFGADPGTLGRNIVLDGKPVTVVGILPPDVHYILATDLYAPIAFDAKAHQAYGGHFLSVIGRLAQGATLDSARAGLNNIAERLDRDHHDSNAGWRVKLVSLSESMTGRIRPILGVLSAAVVFLLLIACANVASLLLGRAAAREREIAVRVALGAGRGRILTQLATESALLSVLGGAVGVALGIWGVDLLLALGPQGLGGLKSVKVDVPLLGFALVASLVAGVVTGLAPALQAFKIDVNSALKDGSRGSESGGRARFRRVLVAVEVTACVLLLVGAGLMLRSLGRLLDVDPGFDPEHVLTVDLNLPDRKYHDDAAQRSFTERTLAELATVPGASVVAAAHTIPFSNDTVYGFTVAGTPPDANSPSANYYGISPDYFRAMGIRLLRGRTFAADDNASGAPVMIIDERFAKQFFPNGDALGQHIVIDAPREHEIVGVVGNVKHYGLEGPSSFEMYTPLAQDTSDQLVFVVRAKGDPAALAPEIRARLRAVDTDQPIGVIKPMTQLVNESVARQRFAVVLLTIFAGVALLLAIVGIYGVISDAVTHRSREMGIRLALGARSADCVQLMMGHGIVPVAVGLLVGLLGAIAATRVMASQLYEVSATDPMTLGVVTVLVGGVAVVASYLPARRVARLDPMLALRAD